VLLEDLVSTYGYAAIAVGTFFEGETILVLGGFAAHRGYLELPWVVMSAFLGTLFGDQLYFYIGRIKGKGVLERRPGWKAKSERVFRLLHRHQNLMTLGFRFVYGLRTVTPFIIGASNISAKRFLVLNVIGAGVWAIAVGVLGYLFGQTLEIILDDIKRYEYAVFGLIAGVALCLWGVRWVRRRRLPRNGDNIPGNK